MAFKAFEMSLRGFALILLLIASFFQMESSNITRIDNYISTGAIGSYIVIIMGLFLETALQQKSHTFIETSLLCVGIILILTSAICAFLNFEISNYSNTLTKGSICIFACFTFVLDLAIHSWS